VSGTGLHIIGLVEGEHVHNTNVPAPDDAIGHCELYRCEKGRYICMTGQRINKYELVNIDPLIDRLNKTTRRGKDGNSEGTKEWGNGVWDGDASKLGAKDILGLTICLACSSIS